MKQKLRLALILGVGVMAMASASILIRLAQAEGAPSLVIAVYRMGTATLVLSIAAIRQQVWRDYAKLTPRELGILTLSGILLGLHFATWITSLAYTSVLSSVVLVTTTPLWIGLAAPLLLGEATPRLTWIAIMIAIAGGITIGLADWSGEASQATTWGNILALGGAILGAGYFIIGRGVREQVRLLAYLWLVYGMALLLLLGWALIGRLPLTGYSPVTMGWMIALGLVPQLVGHTAANYALRHLSATFVGVAILGEPIGSTLLAILFLNEWPGLLQVSGALLILAGIGLASAAERGERMLHRRGQGEGQEALPLIE